MSDNDKLKTDIMDLVNQALVKLKDIGEPVTFSDYNYQQKVLTKDEFEYSDKPSVFEDSEGNKFYKKDLDETKQELACIKGMLKRITEGSASYNESQYYSSNC